jgi:hypothetical protein
MKKRKTPCTEGLLRRNAIHNFDIFIISYFDNEKLLCNSHPTEFSQSSNCTKLISLVEGKSLTECLECLEDVGVASELALFILANFQQGVAT